MYTGTMVKAHESHIKTDQKEAQSTTSHRECMR